MSLRLSSPLYFPAVCHLQKVRLPQTITVVSSISANQSGDRDPTIFLSKKMVFLSLLNSEQIKEFEWNDGLGGETQPGRRLESGKTITANTLKHTHDPKNALTLLVELEYFVFYEIHWNFEKSILLQAKKATQAKSHLVTMVTVWPGISPYKLTLALNQP